MNRRETIILTMAAVVASMAVLFAANASRPAMPPRQVQPKKMSRAEQIERGKYLVTIGGCNDCHTPWIIQPDGKPGPDMSRSLSGHPQDFVIKQPLDLKSDRFDVAWAQPGTAFSGPWGVSFAANLTPDDLTGTGIWTFDTFKNTIRRGRHWGVSRELLPPMPWFNYRHMTDEDLEAVWVYTRTLKPIRNQVPDPIPPAGLAP
ncbi:MAG TPA: diheme cytochrome c-553 [Thermoanaerobaculia bacterium]|nr:diheme cytochrome c-553 [Thermoanaerobaculia bacterium]